MDRRLKKPNKMFVLNCVGRFVNQLPPVITPLCLIVNATNESIVLCIISCRPYGYLICYDVISGVDAVFWPGTGSLWLHTQCAMATASSYALLTSSTGGSHLELMTLTQLLKTPIPLTHPNLFLAIGCNRL